MGGWSVNGLHSTPEYAQLLSERHWRVATFISTCVCEDDWTGTGSPPESVIIMTWPESPPLIMLALRYVYVLALAIWLGGMVDELFGTTNARFHDIAYACGGSLVVTLAAQEQVPGPGTVGRSGRSAMAHRSRICFPPFSCFIAL